jgi:endonuclease/exonuclease/phosphatase family metal-dependent hydrolase
MTVQRVGLGGNGKRRRALALLFFLVIAGTVAGVGAVRRPYGEVVGRDPVLPPGPLVRSDAVRFRVASFNIHSGRAVDGRLDLSRTAAVLSGVDLAGLNEVRGPSPFGGPDQAAALGAQLKMAAVFGPSERRWFVTSFGNGLVSRFPILSWRSQPIRAGRSGSYRAVILAQVKVGEQVIEVIVAHAERGALRDAQLLELRGLFAGAASPVILVGDLNAELSHPELRQMDKLPGAVHALVPDSDVSAKLIDHVYVKGLQVLTAGVAFNQASDHPILWAELEYPASAHTASLPASSSGQRAPF